MKSTASLILVLIVIAFWPTRALSRVQPVAFASETPSDHRTWGLPMFTRVPVRPASMEFCTFTKSARNVASHVGFWSSIWSKRVIDWESHLERGKRYKHLCSLILNHKDQNWLMQERALFVNVQHFMLVGRTGTRVNIGRPRCGVLMVFHSQRQRAVLVRVLV